MSQPPTKDSFFFGFVEHRPPAPTPRRTHFPEGWKAGLGGGLGFRRGFSIGLGFPRPRPASRSLPLPALNRHGSTAVTRRGTDVTLIPRFTSLSLGSLDLKAWASPLRCDRLSFSAQKPYYQGSRPTRGSDLSTQPGLDLGTLPSEPRGLGGPPSSELQSALHGLSDLPPTPTLPPPTHARLPCRPCLPRSQALLSSPSNHRPDSAVGPFSRAL